jgi:hypothetical protein
VPAGEYFPTIASLGTSDGDATGDLNITEAVELYGAGADRTFVGPELVDTTAPTLSLLGLILVEGYTSGGADAAGAALAAFLTGATATDVTFTATDLAGNFTTGIVTVIDTVGPVLTLPGEIVVEATTASGALVNFAVTAANTTAPPQSEKSTKSEKSRQSTKSPSTKTVLSGKDRSAKRG